MKIGDLVIITESFRGGLPYIGRTARFVISVEVNVDGGSYYAQVMLLDNVGPIFCNCTPATELVKALF